MEKDLLENFVVKMNDLQKGINNNYKMEFGNITNPFEYKIDELNTSNSIFNEQENKNNL